MLVTNVSEVYPSIFFRKLFTWIKYMLCLYNIYFLFYCISLSIKLNVNHAQLKNSFTYIRLSEINEKKTQCHRIKVEHSYFELLACRSRQASIVLERYFWIEVSLLSILCMRMEREPFEFRAVPILLRKLLNIPRR